MSHAVLTRPLPFLALMSLLACSGGGSDTGPAGDDCAHLPGPDFAEQLATRRACASTYITLLSEDHTMVMTIDARSQVDVEEGATVTLDAADIVQLTTGEHLDGAYWECFESSTLETAVISAAFTATAGTVTITVTGIDSPDYLIDVTLDGVVLVPDDGDACSLDAAPIELSGIYAFSTWS